MLEYNRGMELIYLDNNATTQCTPEVVAAMMPMLGEMFGNPSSTHRFGQRARQAIDEARGHVATLVHCAESELCFTGCGTESINTAIRGLLAGRGTRKKIITSAVEHSATKAQCEQLAREGVQIVTIGVDRSGALDMEQFRAALDDQTALVSIMWANNETGVIFDVNSIGMLCRAKGVPFHCDATQSIGKMPIDFQANNIDVASFSAHKFHGPKGVGALYVRKGLRVRPLLIGGPQERGRRGGTENVAGIVGMGKAAESAKFHLAEMTNVRELRDELEQGILSRVSTAHVSGDPVHRVPNTTNIGFEQLEAEAILLLLSERGICASAGSACSSGSLEPSPVIIAMGIDEKIAHGAIRFSLSRLTSEAEIQKTLEIVPAVIDRLRAVLPVGV